MPDQIKQRIAIEAARIMVNDCVTNIMVAKQKAMQRLGIQNNRLSPDNTEVETALIQYQNLFRNDRHSALLKELRLTAINAMKMLERFSPRLAGPVLRGTATANDCVSIHLFTDTPEDIHFHLADYNIPFVIDEYQYQQTKNKQIVSPVCRFFAGNIEISLSIFPYNGLRQAPLSSIDDKPMKRADINAVEKLISGG